MRLSSSSIHARCALSVYFFALLVCGAFVSAAAPAVSAPPVSKPAGPAFFPLPPVDVPPIPPAGSGTKKQSSPPGAETGAGQKRADSAANGDAGPVDSAKPRDKGASPAESGEKAPSRTVPPLPLGMIPDKESRSVELMRRGIVRAEIRPSRPLLLSAPFSGTLAEVRVRDGEALVAGQAVALFDPRVAEKGVEDARLALATAIEQVQSMQKGSPLEQEAARTRLARAADDLRAAEERRERCTLSSPFAGRVTEIRAQAGQLLKQGDVVAELAEDGDMEVVCAVPSVWVSRLAPGHVIWVYVEETAKSYEAEFLRFGGRVDAASRTIRAYARFSAPPVELLPGMGGRADFFPQRAQ